MEQNQLFEQLASQYADNPQFQAMLSVLQQRQAKSAGNAEEEAVEEDDELAACRAKLAKASAKIKRQHKELEILNEAVADMERFAVDIANALGACTFCWGEDPRCRSCRGRGQPGAFDPEPSLFERLVLPAWRKHQARQQ